jgi:hypothetical protein
MEFGDVPSPLTFGVSTPTFTLNASVASSLLSMLDSPYLDMQIEAARVLAAAVEGDASNTYILCEAFAQVGATILQLIQKLADALRYQELARDCAVLLAAIASYQPTSAVSCSTLLSSLTIVLSAPSTVCNRDTKRHVATILSVLATKLPKQKVLDLIEPVLYSQDACLRNTAQQVLVSLQA